MFIDNFQGVKDYVYKCNDENAASSYSNKNSGGLLYFRPIALPQLIKAILETQLRTQMVLTECMAKYAQVEMCISREPWVQLLWNVKAQTMIMKYKTNIFHMLIYLFSKDLLSQKEKYTLLKNYAEANDIDELAADQRLSGLTSVL